MFSFNILDNSVSCVMRFCYMTMFFQYIPIFSFLSNFQHMLCCCVREIERKLQGMTNQTWNISVLWEFSIHFDILHSFTYVCDILIIYIVKFASTFQLFMSRFFWYFLRWKSTINFESKWSYQNPFEDLTNWIKFNRYTAKIIGNKRWK